MLEHVEFCGSKCVPKIGQYDNGRLAFLLVTTEDDPDGPGLPVCKPTVNIPEADCPAWQVYIKDWAENEGIGDILTLAGWVEPTGQVEPTGFVTAERYRVTREFRNKFIPIPEPKPCPR